MKLLLLLACLILAPCLKASSGEASNNCFRTHLKDAIEINRERRDLYSKMSHGESLHLSNGLILIEKLLLIPAKKYDRFDQQYQPFFKSPFCEALIDMSETPAFQTELEYPLLPFKSIEGKKFKSFKKRLKDYAKVGDLKNIEMEVENFLNSSEMQNTYFYCMLRHYLESILRTTLLIPIMQEKAQAHQLEDPKEMMLSFIKLQIFGLSQGKNYDEMAVPLQEQGIRLFCNDVPHIPKP